MDDDARECVERELRLLEPEVRRDAARLLELLHPDFFEYGPSGRIWTRATVASGTADTRVAIQARDVQTRRLGPEAFLVTYLSDDEGRVALRSSTWVREGTEWLLYFHQGTLVAEE